MREDLDKERMQANANFEKRKAQLDVIISNNAQIYGRFNGIAGGTMPKVKLLEFDEITPATAGIDILNGIALDSFKHASD